MPPSRLAKLSSDFDGNLRVAAEELRNLALNHWLPDLAPDPNGQTGLGYGAFRPYLTATAWDQLIDKTRPQFHGGAWLPSPTSFPRQLREELGDRLPISHLDDLAKYLALRQERGFLPLPRFARAIDLYRKSIALNPAPSRDREGRLHNPVGPAVTIPHRFPPVASLLSAPNAYVEGNSVLFYFIHGVRVPPWVVTDPAYITIEAIRAESNVELRRVLMELYPGTVTEAERQRGAPALGGFAGYLKDAGAELVDAEPGIGWLYRLTEPVLRFPGANPKFSWSWQDLVTQVVEVVNSTPEPDGTYRRYHLNVPPTVSTAREAVAWTFSMTAEEYRPARES